MGPENGREKQVAWAVGRAKWDESEGDVRKKGRRRRQYSTACSYESDDRP